MKVIDLKPDEVIVGDEVYKKSSKAISIDPVSKKYVLNDVLRAHGKMVLIAVNNNTGNYTVAEARSLYYREAVEVHSRALGHNFVATGEDAEKLGLVKALDNTYWDKDNVPNLVIEKIKYKEFDKTRPFGTVISREEANKCGLVSSTFKRFEGKRNTYGVEIETSSGNIPMDDVRDLNLKCVYDGSLREENGEVYGGEYVTGVLTGDSGIMHLNKILKTISKNCLINPKCGVHVHIGGADFTEEFNVYAFILGRMLEGDMENMMPPSRRNNNYCKKLPPINLLKYLKEGSKEEYNLGINDAYTRLFAEVSARGEAPSLRVNKKTQHPLGPHCGHDRNTMRYCWLNFVPAMFNTRNSLNTKNIPYTLEFRNHSATLNFTKIVKWLQICMGFVYFAENHKQDILNGKLSDGKPITLKNVMRMAYPLTYRDLNEYIQKRTSLFSEKNTEKAEYEKQSNENKPLTLKEAICV